AAAAGLCRSLPDVLYGSGASRGHISACTVPPFPESAAHASPAQRPLDGASDADRHEAISALSSGSGCPTPRRARASSGAARAGDPRYPRALDNVFGSPVAEAGGEPLHSSLSAAAGNAVWQRARPAPASSFLPGRRPATAAGDGALNLST